MLRTLILVSCFYFSSHVFGKTCELTIEGNDQMQFSTKELVADKSCKKVTVTLKHVGKLPKVAMGHNWVLTKKTDMQAVLTEAIKAGAANDYLPKGDKRIVTATKMVGGGESASTTVDLSKLNDKDEYNYFCTFPGHSGIMNGVFKIKSGQNSKS